MRLKKKKPGVVYTVSDLLFYYSYYEIIVPSHYISIQLDFGSRKKW
jgi:hypothetical protein